MKKINVKELTLIGMMIAMLEVSKLVLMWLPNVELVSFWIIMFTLFFRKKILYVITVFILIEGVLFGFREWWIMYLYIWPMLVLITFLFKKNDSAVGWAVISGIYGLLFGFMCSFYYFVVGALSGGIMSGVYSGITWWISGIPYDLIHGVANFIIMLVLYKPIKNVMIKAEKVFK